MLKLFTILFLISGLSCAQTANVIIKVQAEKIDSGEVVFIVGDQPELGNWNPAAIPMKNKEGKIWQKSFEFPLNSLIEFKITKGSWAEEALNSKGEIPQNYVLKIVSDTTVTLAVTNWRNDLSIHKTTFGQITGTVEYYRNLNGEGILQRDVIVWLPPDYELNNIKKYPVLYMHDGQNIIDPATSSFGVDWQVDETADSLIREGAVEPMIIVGVYNTSDRTPEYSNTEKGYNYLKFLVEVVKPLIDNNYRTKPDRDNTAIAGSSMGGIISFIAAWEYPEVFSKAACFSPAFKIGDIDYVTTVMNYEGDKKDLTIYIDNGGIGLEEKLQPGINEMMKALKAKGFVLNEDLFWVKSPEDRHFESAWAKRFWKPLTIFFNNQERQ